MPTDPAELARWFDSHAPSLVLYARQWIGPAAAEDIVQEVFMRLAAQKNTPENIRAWLLTCTRHAAIDALRRDRRESNRNQQATTNRPLFQSAPAAEINPEEAQFALAKLAPDQREVITLHIWNQATFEEIAAITSMPLSTVHHRYRTALLELRSRWELPCPKK